MSKKTHVDALVLTKREPLQPEMKRNNHVRYDSNLQLWVDKQTGQAIVLQSLKRLNQLNSEFGETYMTKTQEGADQPDELCVSDFGETIITRTQEGTDQSEVIGFSEFGETTITETREGADQSEIIEFSEFRKTRLTATSEDADQNEKLSFPPNHLSRNKY